jgi:hypothetical protein
MVGPAPANGVELFRDHLATPHRIDAVGRPSASIFAGVLRMEPGKVATNFSRLVLVGFCCERNRFNRRASLAGYQIFLGSGILGTPVPMRRFEL